MVWGLFGKRNRTQIAALEQEIADLHDALLQSQALANRSTSFRLSVTLVLLAGTLALGFVLGVYREPLRIAVLSVPQGLGLMSSGVEAAEAAFAKSRFAAALRLAQPLANEGVARAQTLVGLIYHSGLGVVKDDNEALRWFRLAAEQGDAEARFHLGVMYDEGQVVPQDHAEAAKWYQLAAEQGNAQAQYNLGLAYAKGEGVAPDNVRAHMWLNLAATRFPASDRGRAAASRNRDVIAGKMTPDELSEAQRMARAWRPR